MKAKRIVVICGPLFFSISSISLAYSLPQVLEYQSRLAFQTFDRPMVSSNLLNATTPVKPCRQGKNYLTHLFST